MPLDDRDLNRAKEIFKKRTTRPLLIIGAIVLLFLMLHPWVQIGAGERGIVLNFGAVQDKVLEEGLHFRVPVMQKIITMDVKVQKVVTDAAAASSDLQEVSSSIALNYHIMPDSANIVYQSIGIYFKERIIDPAIQEVMKAVTANYTAEQLITERPAVSEAIRATLKERLMENNMVVDAFSIVSFSFSRAFTEAIESKQTAEQLALKAKRDLDRIKIEAKQTVVAATAEAEALRLQKMNISRDLIELRKIEANLKAIDKWDGILPRVTGSGAVPLIGIGGEAQR